MKATSFNHVSVSANDLEESTRFYTEVFGLEKIPTYNFGFPVQFLRLGDLQLHLLVRETDTPQFHHFGMTVDDLEAAYAKAVELSIHDGTTFGSEMYELPDGSVQMYIRDPAGNLVEIDWPDASKLDRSVLPEIKKLSDRNPQTGEALRATIFLRFHEERLASGAAGTSSTRGQS